jgi:tape measure domain-containing protein
MAQVDDRVVAMSFESAKFSSGISQAMSDLSKLNSSLSNIGVTSGLGNIEKEANKVSFGGLSGAIDKLKGKLGFTREAADGFGQIEKESSKVGLTGISGALDKLKGRFHFPEAAQGFSEIERSSGRVQFTGLHEAIAGAAKSFSIIQGAAAVALGGLAGQAASAGRKVASGLFGPIKGGLEEYSTNLNSVQTILANTQQSGAKLKDVNKYLLDLNKYSDKTIYNFSQMARNIGTFTAAGVDLKTSTASIKGIANLAALSGSNADQASTAMYQLSQAIASGKVGLQDWNSVVNAGMGGSAFQRALATTADNMGKLKDGAVSLKGPMKNVSINGQSFRESIMAKPGEQSWLTSDVLTETLKQFTGDMTDAQLKAKGFTDEQIKAIQATAKSASEAATNVKTLGQVFDVAKETIGSGWAQTWQTIFGDFGEAKKLFTGLSNGLNGIINDNADARNEILGGWKKLGGRTDLIAGLKAGFEGLKTIIAPLRDAWHEIFPPATAQDLANLTGRFRDFMESIKIGPETADGLKRSFRGLFALLDIGKQIVGGLFTVIGHLLGGLSEGSGGLLNFTGGIGDLIVKLDAWLKKGDRLHNFFATIGDVLSVPLTLIGKLTGALGKLFDFGDGSTEGIGKSLNDLNESAKPVAKTVEGATTAWEKFMGILQKVGKLAEPLVSAIGDALSGVGEAIANALNNQNFDSVFTVLQTGLVAGIFLTIKKALGGGMNIDIGGGILGNLGDTFKALTGNLQAMQQNVKANTILQIAAAVGILAVATVALSTVNPERLASAMTAMAVGFGQLMGSMALLTKIGGTTGFAKMPIIAASLVVLATAILILSGALKVLSTMDWDEIGRGLAALAGMMAIISAGAQLLRGASLNLTLAAPGLIALGIAMNILAAAMKIFATMSWTDLAKGLVGAAGGIAAIGLAANLLPASMIITGPALILLATGLAILGGAVKIFASMDLGSMAKGLAGIVASIIGIGLAMGLMPPTLPLTAIGLGLVASALVVMAGAIKLMGSMDIGTLLKGILGIGAALLVLALGLTAMIVALPGAAALVVAATGLALLVPVLGTLGTMSWSVIGKGLAVVAAALLAISIAGAIAAPGLVILGAALVVLGVGVLAVGAGVRLLAGGIQILAGEGTKGVAVFFAALAALIAIMPKIVIDFVKGLIEIVSQIAQLAPKIIGAMVTIMTLVLEATVKLAPKFAQAATAIIQAIITTLGANAGPIIKAGWELLLQLLKGISDHIGQVVDQVGDIVVKFLNAVSSAYPRIVTAGFNVLLNFLRGIANNLSRVLDTAVDIVIELARGIAGNLSRIISAGASIVGSVISGIMNNIEDLIGRGAAMVNRVITGIGNNIDELIKQGVRMAAKVISGIADAAVDLAEAGGNALLHVLRGIRKWVDDNAKDVGTEGRKLAVSLGNGIVSGALGIDLSGFVRSVIGKIKGAIHSIKSFFHIKSPSQYVADEIGIPLVQGVAMGMEMAAPEMLRAGDTLITTLRKIIADVPNQVDMDVNPTITPVLDLTRIKQDAKQLGDISTTTPIQLAAEISAARQAQLEEGGDPEMGARIFKFEQHNTSPESLSEAEIYRQTSNQLSQAKSALGL